MEKHAKHILDLYFKEYPNAIVRHHLDSYNDFLTRRIPNFIKAQRPTAILQNANRTIKLYLGGKNGDKIRYGSPVNNQGQPLLPNEALLRDLTYSVSLVMDVDMEYVIEYEGSGETKTFTKTIEDFEVCKLPQPVLSKYCNLNLFPTGTIQGVNECRYEPGGYFIIDGAEKVLMSQESLAANVMYTKKIKDDIYYEAFAEVRSGSDDGSIEPRPHKVYVCIEELSQDRNARVKLDEDGVPIPSIGKKLRKGMVVSFPEIDEPIPLAILFRALGVETDEEIIDYILIGETESRKRLFASRLVEMLMARKTEEGFQIFTSAEAIAYIQPRTKYQSQFAVLDILRNKFLPHCGESMVKKAFYLGRMAYKALCVALNIDPPSDRDHFKFKRMEVTGDLCFSLFRDAFKTVVEEFRRRVDTKLNFDTGVYKNEKVQNLILPETIGYFFPSYMVSDVFLKSFKGKWLGLTGVSQELSRISYLGTLSMLRRSMLQIGDRLKAPEPRRLHGSSWGYTCPTDSPDGGDLGLKKHFALMAVASTGIESAVLINELEGTSGFKDIETMQPKDITKETLVVYVNGAWVGTHTNPMQLYKTLKDRRSKGLIGKQVSLTWKVQTNEFLIYSDSGRLMRPLYRLNGDLIDEREITKLKSWNEVLDYVDYIDAEESESLLISMKPAVEPYVKDIEDLHLIYPDVIMRYSHSEIHPSFALSVSTNVIPYCQHNQSPRNMFAVAQTRQALGVFTTNWNHRYDVMSVLLYTPQKPLLQTELLDYVGGGKMVYGINSIVAIMSYTGYNQEDSVIVNKGALDRQMFSTGYYKLFMHSEEKMDEVGTTKTEITNPNKGKFAGVVELKDGYDYSFLDDDGVILPNTEIKPGMILIGCVSPNKDGTFSDISVTSKKDSVGRIQSVYKYRNQDGLFVVKVKVHDYRYPTLADKFQVRSCAQKGTIGMILPEADMPFTAEGIRPDIIMNPHAIPSRMTGAMNHEMITCKAAALDGFIADATPFVPREDPAKVYGDLLERNGYNRLGEEYLYNGMTGERILSTIFIGSVYYSRLKHMVQDKINSRTTGPNKLLTRQPTGGRANDGGLRIGEMERDALLGHGISNFIQESMTTRSDGWKTIYNPETGRMDVMLDENKPGEVELPYAMKLLVQEFESMNVDMKIIGEQ